MSEFKVSARLVVTVAAAVVREEGGWVNRWTAERVHGIITGTQDPPKILKGDRRTAEAAMKWLSKMNINDLSESDLKIRWLLTHCYNYKTRENEIGQLSQVMVAYAHRDKYERSRVWNLLATHSRFQGMPGSPMRDLPKFVRVHKKRTDTIPYYTACKCSTPHGMSTKKAGGCQTSEKRFKEISTYSLVDESHNLFKVRPDSSSGLRPWPEGATLLIRKARIKEHERIRPSRGGEPVECTWLSHVDALIQK